ncbi:MAG: hypothetical protein ACKOA9_01060 [Actinomycetota bacterium]
MTAVRRPSWSRRASWAAVWVAVWAFTMALLMQRIVVVRDEAWMLWVATRLSRGDVLYREVYNVTTPLAAWLAAGAVRVTGPQMATVRALLAAIFASQVLLGLSVVRWCGVRRAGQAAFVAVLLAVAAPFAAFVSLYSALAIGFGLATLRMTLWWLDAADSREETRCADRAAWAIGVTGGLAFWTKPNVGALVALAVGAAVLAAMWGTPIRRWWPALARMAGGAAVVSVVCAAVILATGARSAFVDQVFRSKGEYLGLGFGYLSALEKRFDALVTGAEPFQVRRVVKLVVQAAPTFLLVAVAVGAVRSRHSSRPPLVALAAFTVAGILAILPRPGLNHVTGVMPLVVPALFGTWMVGIRARPVPSTGGVVPAVAIGATALGVVVALAVPLVSPNQPDRLRRDAPHFTGTPVTERQLQSSARLARELRARGVDTVFIVRKDAGFLYLRTETRNPLPFDIVERSDLGGDDEAGVIRRLAAGEAEWVCVRKPGSGGTSDAGLVPVRLERWIRTHLEFRAELARCELHRWRPATSQSVSRPPHSR